MRKKMEKILREIEKLKISYQLGVTYFKDLCYYPRWHFPEKFQLPDFVKYDKKRCPQTHLRIYCNDMF